MIKKEEILKDGYDYEDYDDNIVDANIIIKNRGCCGSKGCCNKDNLQIIKTNEKNLKNL